MLCARCQRDVQTVTAVEVKADTTSGHASVLTCLECADPYRYAERKREFERLCRDLGAPIPQVSPALPTDPCDVTDPASWTVRLNAKATNCDPTYHAAHVLGHWLADLHASDPQRADLVADILAGLILANER